MAKYVKIDVKPFVFGETPDFDLWVKRFQRAVDAVLADDADPAQKSDAYLKYIGTKLDDFSWRIYESSSHHADWTRLKAELSEKLTDPAKAQHFRDNIDSIKWDGELPLHAYENVILSSTRDLDPDVAQNNNLFKRETFKRFVAGLPPDYQSYIEMNLPVRTYDISQARERAEKFQYLLQKNKGRNPLASREAVLIPPPMASYNAYEATTFESIQEQITRLNLAQRENVEMQRETNRSLKTLVEAAAALHQASPAQDGSHPYHGVPCGDHRQYEDQQPYDDSPSYDNQRPNEGYGGRGYQDDLSAPCHEDPNHAEVWARWRN